MRVRTLSVALFATVALALVSCGGEGDEAGGNGTGDADGGGTTVSVTGTDGLAFEPEQVTAPAGEITVELTSQDAVNHTFTVEDANGDVEVVAADAGQTATGSVDLEGGTYTFYCDVPGHREAGMEGSLQVG